MHGQLCWLIKRCETFFVADKELSGQYMMNRQGLCLPRRYVCVLTSGG